MTAATTATISAAAGGTTKTATLSIAPAATADRLSITKAEYAAGNAQLSVEATSTSSTATLQVRVTASGALVGTLANAGGGRYRGRFSWPTYPQTITITSTSGGTVSGAVALK